MTLLALLRHAETAWSAEGRIQGRTDVPLSDAGRGALQGRMLPHEFRDLRVVSSPLRRCTETASGLGLSPRLQDARLAEMRWGTWEGRRLSDLRVEFGESMKMNEERGLDFSPPGGESPREVLARVRGWLEDVADSGLPTLGITHRGVVRVVFAAAMDWDMRGRPPVKLDWSALHVFNLDDSGMPRVTRLNVPLEDVGLQTTPESDR